MRALVMVAWAPNRSGPAVRRAGRPGSLTTVAARQLVLSTVRAQHRRHSDARSPQNAQYEYEEPSAQGNPSNTTAAHGGTIGGLASRRNG